MFPALDDIAAADIDNRASNTLCGVDNDVVVLGHMKVVQGLNLLSNLVHNPLVDCIRNAIVDELGEHETVTALVEHLEGIGCER